MIRKFDLFAVAFLIVLSLNLVIPFMKAFINETDSIQFFLNDYHEQYVEAIVFPLWVIFGIITFVRLLKIYTSQNPKFKSEKRV